MKMTLDAFSDLAWCCLGWQKSVTFYCKLMSNLWEYSLSVFFLISLVIYWCLALGQCLMDIKWESGKCVCIKQHFCKLLNSTDIISNYLQLCHKLESLCLLSCRCFKLIAFGYPSNHIITATRVLLKNITKTKHRIESNIKIPFLYQVLCDRKMQEMTKIKDLKKQRQKLRSQVLHWGLKCRMP